MVMAITMMKRQKVYIIKSIRHIFAWSNFTKNHEITDYLLEKACERKGIEFEPKQVDNTEEEAAKRVIVERVQKVIN